MVTEDQLTMIQKLRSNGLSHQDIADKLLISRSTIAYQLSKLKEATSQVIPLKIIEAQGFEANQTTVTFTPHDFENNRTSTTLYASGKDVFEIKEGLIHKTTMPHTLMGKDYGELYRIINEKPNWHQVFNLKPEKDRFSRDYRYPINPVGHGHRGTVNHLHNHKFNHEWKRNFSRKVAIVESEIFTNVPTDMVGQIQYFDEKPSDYKQYIAEKSKELSNLIKQVELTDGTMVPKLIVAWFEEMGITSEDVAFCIKSGIKDPEILSRLKVTGCSNHEQLVELKKSSYDLWNDYQLATKYHRLLHPQNPQQIQGNRARRHARAIQEQHSTPFLTKDQLEKIVDEGWNEQELASAIRMGFNPLRRTKEAYEKMPNQLRRLGLRMEKDTVEWASNVDLSAYEGFSSPRAAVLFGIIQMSATNTLRLDSLLSTYNSAAEPGGDIANVKQLHDQVLSRPPFIDICMSDPVSGMVEKTSGDSYAPKPQVVVVEKIVEVAPSIAPLFSINQYKQLMASKVPLELKLIEAINRRDLDDSNTRAWIRFETHSKSALRVKGIEISKEEKSFNVKLVDHITSILNLTDRQCQLLHQSRMIRNDEQHPEEPSGLILNNNHVKNILEITERIV